MAIVSKAATHARCLFSTSPTQTFALVLAFNRESNMLRFLVFHPGGLTASEGYNIAERDGLKEIARLFLTLASWHSAGEAGAITCYSDNTYLLPADQEGTCYVSAAVDGALSRPHCTRDRRTFVYRLRLPANVPQVVQEPLSGMAFKPLVESGGSFGRPAGFLKKQLTPPGPFKSEPIRPAGRSGRPRSRSLTPPRPTNTPGEKWGPVTEERSLGLSRSEAGPTARGAPMTVSLPITQERRVVGISPIGDLGAS